jgi:hypothetical protein
METLENHLRSRHCDLALHRPVVDESTRTATFFLWNLSGQLVGFQTYKPDCDKTRNNDPREGRYFTYRSLPSLALFGVESLFLRSDVVFVTEGVFDACRLTERGFPALAVLSNNQKPELRDWLLSLNRRVVAVCDNDAAGKKLAKFGTESATMEDHDLGDASDEAVDRLLKELNLS